jgi:hypothetical protein
MFNVEIFFLKYFPNVSHVFGHSSVRHDPEPVFLNVYGAQESIPRNEFRQLM